MGVAAEGRATGVVLVHGAWFAAEAWSDVADVLRASAVPVAVPRLPGGSLAADTAAVLEAIDALGETAPVVCGHSYGGAVITGLPPDRIAHLVYLAAVMPTEEETALGLADTEPTSMLAATRPEGRTGFTVLDPAAAASMLFGQSSAEQGAAFAAALVPQNMAPGTQSPESVAWRSVPSTYIVCDQDQTLSPVLQRRLAKRATSTEIWESDHTPFVREPEKIARLLARLAQTPTI